MPDEPMPNDTIVQTIKHSITAINEWIKAHTKSNGAIKSKPFENGASEMTQHLSAIEKHTNELQAKLEDAQETIVKDILTISSMENDLNDAQQTIQQMKANQETLMAAAQTSDLLDKTGTAIAIDNTMTEDGCITHIVKAIGRDGYFDDAGTWHNAADVEHASDDMSTLIAQLPKIIAEMQQESAEESMPLLIARLISISNQLQRLSDKEANINDRDHT